VLGPVLSVEEDIWKSDGMNGVSLKPGFRVAAATLTQSAPSSGNSARSQLQQLEIQHTFSTGDSSISAQIDTEQKSSAFELIYETIALGTGVNSVTHKIYFMRMTTADRRPSQNLRLSRSKRADFVVGL